MEEEEEQKQEHQDDEEDDGGGRRGRIRSRATLDHPGCPQTPNNIFDTNQCFMDHEGPPTT